MCKKNHVIHHFGFMVRRLDCISHISAQSAVATFLGDGIGCNPVPSSPDVPSGRVT